METEKRGRNWCFIYYEENDKNLSLEDIKQSLNEQGLIYAISPKHDNDIEEKSNQKKKSHYHILLVFPGNKSYSQVAEITKNLGCSFPIRTENLKGMIRYFIHLDDPKKAQYNKNDIYNHGLNIDSAFKLTDTQQAELIKFTIQAIEENNLKTLKELTLFFLDDLDMLKFIRDNSYFFERYIK